jgi:hypothetical protein
MDMSPDGSPIIDRTHIDGLYLNCGWCYGGFKAVPGSGFCFAHLMATDRPHEAAARYRLDRFATGRGLMDEEGTGASTTCIRGNHVEGRGRIDRHAAGSASPSTARPIGLCGRHAWPRRFWPTGCGSWAGPSSITARAAS